MRRVLVIIGVVCLMSGIARAYVTDAPHNETNSVGCGDCHSYSLWWQFSPTGSNNSNFSQYTDAVCNSCHTEIGYPNKISHSFSSMAEMHNDATGEWSTKCIDCHDPHQQSQLDWLTDDVTLADDLFLVTGTVESVTLDAPLTGETTITYNPAITINNTNWSTTDSSDPDVLTWENKNGSSDRGLIFVHDTTDLANTYSIISVDSTAYEIILQGGPDSAQIVPSDTFGLIYGQLIRQSIETPNSGSRYVKFFDPIMTSGTGGFVDHANVPREGICQVCHTLTDYWLEDGSVINPSLGSSPPDHNSESSCTLCHDTASGFKPLNADHTFITSTGSSCSSCHPDDEDVVITTHKGICSYCHTSPPNLISSISDGTSGKWPSSPHENGNCTDCHDANGPASLDISGDFSNHPKAFDDDDNSTNGFDGHAGQVSSAVNCSTACHFHNNKDIITQIHTGSPTTTDPCIKCHDLSVITAGSYSGTQMISKGSYSGTGQLINEATAGSGDCTNCHTVLADNWKNHVNQATHEGQVTGAPLCVRCHTGDVIDVVHYFNCGHCHDGANDGALKSLAATFGPGDCTNCHGTDFYRHDPSKFRYYDHEGYGTVAPEPAESSPDCMVCHNEGPDTVFDIHTPIVLPLPPLPPLNVCAYCHDTDGFLVGNAMGHGLTDPGFGAPNTCSTCHIDQLSGHPSHVGSGSGSTMNGFVLPTERCVSCHVGDLTEDVHNNNCFDCHKNLFRTGHTDLVDGLPVGAYNDDDGHLECVQCHDALGASFFAADFINETDHWKKNNHEGQVDSSPGCVNCHDGTPMEDVHWGAGLCTACHLQTGELIGSASGLGTGKPPTNSIDCIICHGDFILHNSLDIDLSHSLEVQETQSCTISGCHTEADLVMELHNINGCSTCHESNGELSPPAVPFGGECIDCHTTYFTGHIHGANAHYVSEGGNLSSSQPCIDCHSSGSWNDILAEHNLNNNGGCTTCHDSTRSTNIGQDYSDVADVILIGSSSSPVTCLACHDNAAAYSSSSFHQ